ncbi:bifunctional pyr operon transcriptional regulator/uracil phosphoribosyltransferase PyrR [Candidatus Dependentiae bacterium]|nr:bifunctional pyr operon transcriptional regulator/uracil phosphoribosyltransferase PyrR [Candidatus Dependentiae bacterium]
MKVKAQIMSKADMFRTLKRLAHEIIEQSNGAKNLVILGIQRRGVPIGRILKEEIDSSENTNVPFGILDITLYRDDLSTIGNAPMVNATDIPFNLNGKDVILVDDVLYTGRTIRAALDEIMDFGRPASIQVAVLIDRGHRELPIMGNYIGRKIPTAGNEIIEVKLKEVDKKYGVFIIVRDEKPSSAKPASKPARKKGKTQARKKTSKLASKKGKTPSRTKTKKLVSKKAKNPAKSKAKKSVKKPVRTKAKKTAKQSVKTKAKQSVKTRTKKSGKKKKK